MKTVFVVYLLFLMESLLAHPQHDDRRPFFSTLTQYPLPFYCRGDSNSDIYASCGGVCTFRYSKRHKRFNILRNGQIIGNALTKEELIDELEEFRDSGECDIIPSTSYCYIKASVPFFDKIYTLYLDDKKIFSSSDFEKIETEMVELKQSSTCNDMPSTNHCRIKEEIPFFDKSYRIYMENERIDWSSDKETAKEKYNFYRKMNICH